MGCPTHASERRIRRVGWRPRERLPRYNPPDRMTTPKTRLSGRRAPGTLIAMVNIGLLCVLLPGKAHAYLDAGTGSMILQVVIAGVTGALITLRLYWARIKARFSGQPIEAEKAAASDEPGNEPN
jgi:hypothetical protein